MRISDWSSDVCSSDLDRRICEDDQGRLQPLCPMHSQHADAVPLRGRVADNFNIAPIKPVDKHLERGMRVAFECQRGVEQFINGIARLRAQTPEQLSPYIERAGENMLQIQIRRGEIGLPQQSIKRREQIRLAKRSEEHKSALQYLMRHQ